jgi:histone H3/H4
MVKMSESHGSWSSEEMVLGIDEVSVVRIVERGMEKRVSSSAMFSLATVIVVSSVSFVRSVV